MLDKSLLVDLETRWRFIVVYNYAALSAAPNQWWKRVTKILPGVSKKEIVSWIVETAMLESQGPQGGNWHADDLGFTETSFTPEFVGKMLVLRKAQLEDIENGIVGGEGVKLGTSWMRQISGQFAYWPQRQVANLLKNGELATALCYDGRPYFDAAHPYDPNDTSKGVYSNIITNVPIHTGSSTALASLKTVFGRIGAIKMPNGSDPRFLKPIAIFSGSVLYPDAVEVTKAEYIAMAATAGNTTAGGSTDIRGVMKSMAFGDPINVPELTGFESDQSYFVVAGADGVPEDDMSGFVYVQREAFGVKFYTGAGGGDGVDAILDRANELEWHAQGRNVAQYGHPYRVFKCKPGA